METIVSSSTRCARHLASARESLSQLPDQPSKSRDILQNSEIFTLTYGSIVRQLITDLEDMEEVNKQLDSM